MIRFIVLSRIGCACPCPFPFSVLGNLEFKFA
jgi:hypothetical protein